MQERYYKKINKVKLQKRKIRYNQKRFLKPLTGALPLSHSGDFQRLPDKHCLKQCVENGTV